MGGKLTSQGSWERLRLFSTVNQCRYIILRVSEWALASFMLLIVESNARGMAATICRKSTSSLINVQIFYAVEKAARELAGATSTRSEANQKRRFFVSRLCRSRPVRTSGSSWLWNNYICDSPGRTRTGEGARAIERALKKPVSCRE